MIYLYLLNFIFLICLILLLLLYAKRKNTNNPVSHSAFFKFITYFVITNVFLSLILLNHQLWILLYSVLALTGMVEILKVGKTIKEHLVVKFFFIGLVAVSLLLLTLVGLSAQNTLYLAALYFIVVSSDGFNQLFGIAFGKLHFLPRLSPGKTLEGYAGGIVATFVINWLILTHTAHPLPLGQIVSFIGLTILLSNSGDLLFSWLKRISGIKDFSNLIPYHGGVLDRFDSFIVASFSMLILIR